MPYDRMLFKQGSKSGRGAFDESDGLTLQAQYDDARPLGRWMPENVRESDVQGDENPAF